MNIVKPFSSIVNFDIFGKIVPFTQVEGIGLLRKIVFCARISHRSENDVVDENSWEKFIKFVVLEKGDWSVVEHASVTVDTVVDRGITHEWVRHRLFSFTQESTRFVNYVKKMPPNFILPKEIDDRVVHEHGFTAKASWEMVIKDVEWCYRGLINSGISPQIARSILPNALASRIITTGNLRQWRHFLIMRTTKETHPQMREVTIPLLKQFQETIPLLFDDIVPEQKQSIAMTKIR